MPPENVRARSLRDVLGWSLRGRAAARTDRPDERAGILGAIPRPDCSSRLAPVDRRRPAMPPTRRSAADAVFSATPCATSAPAGASRRAGAGGPSAAAPCRRSRLRSVPPASWSPRIWPSASPGRSGARRHQPRRPRTRGVASGRGQHPPVERRWPTSRAVRSHRLQPALHVDAGGRAYRDGAARSAPPAPAGCEAATERRPRRKPRPVHRLGHRRGPRRLPRSGDRPVRPRRLDWAYGNTTTPTARNCRPVYAEVERSPLRPHPTRRA